MNSSAFVVKLALACVCLILTVVVIVRGETRMRQQEALATQEHAGNTGDKSAELFVEFKQKADEVKALQKFVQEEQLEVQNQLQKRQEEINKGAQSQQIGANLLKDVTALAVNPATGAVRNEKLKEILDRDGITLRVDETSFTNDK